MPKPKFKKTWKLKLNQIQFLNYRKFCLKKRYFGQILFKIFSKTRKLKKSTSFEPIILNLKTQTRNILEFWNPKNSNQNTKEATKLKPEEIQALVIFKSVLNISIPCTYTCTHIIKGIQYWVRYHCSVRRQQRWKEVVRAHCTRRRKRKATKERRRCFTFFCTSFRPCHAKVISGHFFEYRNPQN